MPRNSNNRYSYYDDEDDNKKETKKEEEESTEESTTEESTTTESSNESTEESVNEIVVIDPEVFGVSISEVDESNTDNRPIIDEERFVYNPADGSISHKLDKDGCPHGYFWNELKGRCSPNSEKEL